MKGGVVGRLLIYNFCMSSRPCSPRDETRQELQDPTPKPLALIDFEIAGFRPD